MKTPPGAASARFTRRTLLLGASAGALVGLPAVMGCSRRRVVGGGDTAVAPDAIVVGDSIGAVAAAIELQRAALRVVLLTPGEHVGGMTTAGLSVTDTGVAGTIGGFAHQLYADLGGHYGLGSTYTFTPDVAQGVVDGYLARSGVPIVRSAPVSQLRYVAGSWVATTIQGQAFRAPYIIDATYEGDLLALADIAFRLGREGRSEFGEPDAGIGPPSHGDAACDPHRVPGDPASGLLPGVEPAEPAPSVGAADGRVMAPSFRLAVTSDSRRRNWSAPPGYDRADYEITGRVVAAGGNPLKNVHRIEHAQNQADLNNYQMGSTDLIAQGGRAWIEADHATRSALLTAYRQWTEGLMHFLSADQSVPAGVQATANGWGIDPDQFPAQAGWSPLLYVREGRRLVGQKTLTEFEVLGRGPVADPIALASYPMDAHDCRYLVDSRGRLAVEGDLSVPHPPVGVPLGALIPASAPPGFVSCVGISTSHVAWCAVRTEPVLAMIGQAAGVLVALAAPKGLTPATVPYRAVRGALLARGAVLSWAHQAGT